MEIGNCFGRRKGGELLKNKGWRKIGIGNGSGEGINMLRVMILLVKQSSATDAKVRMLEEATVPPQFHMVLNHG